MALFINTLAAVTAGTVLATTAFAQSAGGPRPYTVLRRRERAGTQADRGPCASRSAGPGRGPDPIPGGERAHRTGVRGGRPQTISTGRTSAHNRRRPALVVGGLE
jgi:hypothetical protein